MGRPRKPGLEWLDQENAKQHLWARDYLRFKGFEDLDADQSISWKDLLRLGQKIEEEKGARELFRDMKDAWRQERSRSKKKEEGYRPCLFTLKGATRDDLQRMANEQGTDATALLEKLIEKAYKTHLKKQQRAEQPKQPKQPKQTIYGDRLDINQLRDSPEDAKASAAEHEEPAAQSPENRSATQTLEIPPEHEQHTLKKVTENIRFQRKRVSLSMPQKPQGQEQPTDASETPKPLSETEGNPDKEDRE
jgi:hypothetical protein